MRKTQDLNGKQFGDWTVIERDMNYHCSKYNAYWTCKCKCGIEKPVNSSHLRLGKSVSCRKCSEHKHKGKLCSRIFHRIKHRSKLKKEVNLGPNNEAREFLYELLYIKQNGKCALSGLPIVVANTIKGDMIGETTASLDRIDSSKGYTRDNVQWVHKWINTMKWDFPQDRFIDLCGQIYKHQIGKPC